MVVLLAALGVSTAPADTYFVDSMATGSGDGSSWENALVGLQDALAAAVPGDETHVAAGTYYPDEGAGMTDNNRDSTFLLRSGISIYGGFPPGGGDTADPLLHTTILSGDLA